LVFPEYQEAHNTLEALDLAKTAHNLKLLEIAYTERAFKKQKTEGDSQSAPGELDLVSLGSTPEANASVDSLTKALIGRDAISEPNGTASQWNNIDDCYIDDPAVFPSWENESMDSLFDEETPKMIPPPEEKIVEVITKQNNENHVTQLDEDILADIKWCEYQDKHNGWCISNDSCLHKANPESVTSTFRGNREHTNKDIDDAPSKYDDWIARG
jgi:hypothetical protein